MVEGKRRCFILFLFSEVVLNKYIFSIIIANHISFGVGGIACGCSKYSINS